MRFPRLHDRVNGIFLGIDIHGRHEGKLWHKMLVGLPLAAGEALNDARLWVFYRIHPRHRYNRVRLRLPPRYYENDVRLLHAMFAVFCDHIEEEGRNNIEELITVLEQELAEGMPSVSAEATARQIVVMREKLALHDWWTVRRPAHVALSRELSIRLYRVKPYQAVPDPDGNGGLLTKRQLRERLELMRDDLRAMDQEMCHRLVDVREYLWT